MADRFGGKLFPKMLVLTALVTRRSRLDSLLMLFVHLRDPLLVHGIQETNQRRGQCKAFSKPSDS
jgi:hypothetical protein